MCVITWFFKTRTNWQSFWGPVVDARHQKLGINTGFYPVQTIKTGWLVLHLKNVPTSWFSQHNVSWHFLNVPTWKLVDPTSIVPINIDTMSHQQSRTWRQSQSRWPSIDCAVYNPGWIAALHSTPNTPTQKTPTPYVTVTLTCGASGAWSVRVCGFVVGLTQSDVSCFYNYTHVCMYEIVGAIRCEHSSTFYLLVRRKLK